MLILASCLCVLRLYRHGHTFLFMQPLGNSVLQLLISHLMCREEPETSSSDQPAGFQLVLKATLHEAAISAAALCSGAGLLALADHAGSLSLVDLNRLTVLCTRQLAEQPITALSLGSHSMHPQRAPGGKRTEALDTSAEDRYRSLCLCASCVAKRVLSLAIMFHIPMVILNTITSHMHEG